MILFPQYGHTSSHCPCIHPPPPQPVTYITPQSLSSTPPAYPCETSTTIEDTNNTERRTKRTKNVKRRNTTKKGDYPHINQK